MFSPSQSADFIDSKMVSTVVSACFCVSWRLATKIAIRSLFNIRGPRKGKSFDRGGRYLRYGGSSKHHLVRFSGRLFHTLDYFGQFRRALALSVSDPTQEGFQGFSESGFCRSLGL